MLKDRRQAAQKVAQSLQAAEAALDIAISRAAELNAAMPAARAEARLSAVVGQQALDHGAAAFAALVAARRAMVETHQSLDDTKTRIGLRTLGFGDGLEKIPEDTPRGEHGGHLRAVG